MKLLKVCCIIALIITHHNLSTQTQRTSIDSEYLDPAPGQETIYTPAKGDSKKLKKLKKRKQYEFSRKKMKLAYLKKKHIEVIQNEQNNDKKKKGKNNEVKDFM